MAAELTDTARWQARVAQAAAAGTVPLQHASLAIGLIGVASVALQGAAVPMAVWLVLSVLQSLLLAGGLWLGLRLRVDAVLFHALAGADDMDGLDRAMEGLGWIDAGKAGRPMPDRVAGLMRLVRLLALLVAAQSMLLASAELLAWR